MFVTLTSIASFFRQGPPESDWTLHTVSYKEQQNVRFAKTGSLFQLARMQLLHSPYAIDSPEHIQIKGLLLSQAHICTLLWRGIMRNILVSNYSH